MDLISESEYYHRMYYYFLYKSYVFCVLQLSTPVNMYVHTRIHANA